MLKKLLKYDLKYVYRVLIIFYVLSIFFAIVTRIFIGCDTTICKVIHDISSGITISMLINIVINNIMRLWARYNENIYKDESYLTHTLPVKKETIYNSKFLTLIITTFTSVVVIGISIFIAYYTKDNFELLKESLTIIISTLNSTYIKFIIICVLILFLEISFITCCGFTGIILGHNRNDKKILFSVLYGFAIYMISQILLILFTYIYGLFDENIMKLFTSNNIENIITLKKCISFEIIIYFIYIIIDYIFNIKLFKKGVNIE